MVVSFVGDDQRDISGEHFTHGNIVRQGGKGVWDQPLGVTAMSMVRLFEPMLPIRLAGTRRGVEIVKPVSIRVRGKTGSAAW